jgi:hypothetical protein
MKESWPPLLPVPHARTRLGLVADQPAFVSPGHAGSAALVATGERRPACRHASRSLWLRHMPVPTRSHADLAGADEIAAPADRSTCQPIPLHEYTCQPIPLHE